MEEREYLIALELDKNKRVYWERTKAKCLPQAKQEAWRRFKRKEWAAGKRVLISEVADQKRVDDNGVISCCVGAGRFLYARLVLSRLNMPGSKWECTQ